jgi:sugar phosphate isomerase/epimerase
MIKLSANTVLFGQSGFASAARLLSAAGYDGVEVAALAGMCEHLQLSNWRTQAPELRTILDDHGLQPLAMEESALNEERLRLAFEAAAEIGIPVVCIGSGGTSGDEDSLKSAVHDTPTTLAAIEAISSPGFGVNMDPSHIHRAGEDVVEALRAVVGRVRHVHIRDCPSREPSPGPPPQQACGRGQIDLAGYCGVLAEAGYDGALSLEVIGAQTWDDPAASAVIAAESAGYLNACLKALGAR